MPRRGGGGGGRGGDTAPSSFSPVPSPAVSQPSSASPSSSAPPPPQPSSSSVAELTSGVKERLNLQDRAAQPSSSKALVPPKRPGYGSLGKKIEVRANHFLVEVADRDLHHYDVNISYTNFVSFFYLHFVLYAFVFMLQNYCSSSCFISFILLLFFKSSLITIFFFFIMYSLTFWFISMFFFLMFEVDDCVNVTIGPEMEFCFLFIYFCLFISYFLSKNLI